jgi:hypothetical protein
MSSIDPTHQMIQLMREQLTVARSAHSSSVLAATNLKAQGQPKKKTQDQPSATTPSEQRLIAQVAAISPEDPQRHQKAFRLFMASVLAQEFGDALSHEREFEHLLERVIQSMETDETLKKAMRKAAIFLLEKARMPGTLTTRQTD